MRSRDEGLALPLPLSLRSIPHRRSGNDPRQREVFESRVVARTVGVGVVVVGAKEVREGREVIEEPGFVWALFGVGQAEDAQVRRQGGQLLPACAGEAAC